MDQPIRVSLFGRRLRALRQQEGLTQQEMADRLQIHRTTYTKYETEDVAPSQDGLLRLATLFHVSVDYLLGRVEDSGSSTHSLKDDEPSLNPNEQEIMLLLAYRKLDSEQRARVLQQTQDLARSQPE